MRLKIPSPEFESSWSPRTLWLCDNSANVLHADASSCRWHALANPTHDFVGLPSYTLLLKLSNGSRLLPGRYKKEKREDLFDLVNARVKADTEHLDTQCKELLETLHPEESDYLVNYYQPKKTQFCQACSLSYRNISTHSTQRNEGYHVFMKDRSYKHTPLPKAIQIMVDRTKQFGRNYGANDQQRSKDSTTTT